MEGEFPSGWISEFYPAAAVTAPGLGEGRIRPGETGRLSWKSLQIGGMADGPETTLPVWLIPREVDAQSVRTTGGETERYLFYRGVANIEAPVRVRRDGLLREGLFPKEAETMLNTWEDSYFRSRGLRLFYLFRGAGRIVICL